MFLQSGCYEEAFVAFEKANCWELVFVCSAKLQHSTAQRMEAARRIAGEGVGLVPAGKGWTYSKCWSEGVGLVHVSKGYSNR